MNSICQVQLRWLTPEEGGRMSPVRSGRYTPTARFAGEEDQFSIVLELAGSNEAYPTSGTMRLLNPDLVEILQRLKPSVALEIMEGARVVAHGVVEGSDVNGVIGAAQKSKLGVG